MNNTNNVITLVMKNGDMPIKGNHIPRQIENLVAQAEQIDIPVEHYFSKGTYCRMMIMGPDTYLVGKTHKHDHLAILLQGEVQVISKYGSAIYKAPYVVNVLAGDKRAFVSVGPVKWMTIHATEETDLSKLEHLLVED